MDINKILIKIAKNKKNLAELLHKCFERGADINYRDEEGNTALIYAAKFNQSEKVKILLQHKADKTLVGRNGFSAYDWAKFFTHKEVLKLLTNNIEEVIKNACKKTKKKIQSLQTRS